MIGGYYNYRWYDQLTEKGIKFVTRGVKNAIVMDGKLLDTNLFNDIYDSKVVMGSAPAGNLTLKSYREIMTFDEEGKPITFITNIFDLSKEDIILLYKKRWEIELFFKVLIILA